jgi:glutamine phosphoribosylpyrophosphate amidotransferase
MRAIGRGTSEQFCRACFDGSYPVPVPQQLEMDKMQFEPTFIPDPVLLHPKS